MGSREETKVNEGRKQDNGKKTKIKPLVINGLLTYKNRILKNHDIQYNLSLN